MSWHVIAKPAVAALKPMVLSSQNLSPPAVYKTTYTPGFAQTKTNRIY